MEFVAGLRAHLEDLLRTLGVDDKVPVLRQLPDGRVLVGDVLKLDRRVANGPPRLDPQLQREHVRDVGRVRLALCAFSSPTTSVVHSRVSLLTCDSSHSTFPTTTHRQHPEPSRSSTKTTVLSNAEVVRPPLEVESLVLVLQPLLDGDFQERREFLRPFPSALWLVFVSPEYVAVRKDISCAAKDCSDDCHAT